MSTMILVLGYLGCTQECDPGYGMVDGVCYELAEPGEPGGTSGTGSDGSGTTDTGAGGSGSGDSGAGTGGTGGTGTDGTGTGGAGETGAGTGGGGVGETGAGTGGGTGSGDDTSLMVSGTLQVAGAVASTAVCTISMWAASDVDPTTGLPDRSSGATRDISNQTTACPTDSAPLAYSVSLNLPVASSVYLYASIDQDGDLLTAEDRAEEGSASNPVSAEPGGELTGVAFTLTAPVGR